MCTPIGHTARMASPYLYFADEQFSRAELTAACLDGHLIEVGEGFIPADAVETTELRAGSLAPLLSPQLAATYLSAAWVWGALPEPPPRHTLQRAVPRRIHFLINRRVHYRDTAVHERDLTYLLGCRIASPGRTLADLSRKKDPVHRAAAVALARVIPSSIDAALAWFNTAGTIPNSRAARAFIETLKSS